MFVFNIFTRKALLKLLNLCLIFILFQGCKIYQDPISIEQALNNKETVDIKITMLNGDKFIYENIEFIEGNYYGIHSKDGEKGKTHLDKDNIKSVQYRNKKSSKGSNTLGIGIGILSVVFGILMI